jgi:putative radical SAM enzyme (TIGR03279 family)
VAVVPVGLTRFRPAEDELIAVTAEKAREVIEQVQKIQVLLSKGKGGSKAKKQKAKSRCIWLADEWFLIAGLDLPSAEDYEDYPQIGNGVGSIRQFIQQFETAFEKLQPMQVEPERKLVWVVGNAVEKAFEPIVQQLNQIPGLSVNMAALCSRYWGQSITVTGLLTGQDLLEALQGRDLGNGILLPSVMLKQGEPRFLDDMTVEQLASLLKTRILPVSGVEELISAACGRATAEVEL